MELRGLPEKHSTFPPACFSPLYSVLFIPPSFSLFSSTLVRLFKVARVLRLRSVALFFDASSALCVAAARFDGRPLGDLNQQVREARWVTGVCLRESRRESEGVGERERA